MKVLHFVKTSDGARWAVEMVEKLCKMGVEVTVVLPINTGKMINAWTKTQAKVIYSYSELPVRRPWRYFSVQKKIKKIIDLEKPDIIHSHFFSQTILLRKVLRKSSIPLIFQVPGPLHLEKFFFRKWDVLSARKNDSWIASSKYIKEIYLKEGVEEKRVGMSYYGNNLQAYDEKSENLRDKLKINEDDFVIGNISYFYPPKKYLFQRIGLKGHELLIEIAKKMRINAIFFGSQLGKNQNYYQSLKRKETNKIKLPGALNPFEVSKGWNTMNVCVHLPLSENCGGILEPLLHNIPVISCYTGGIPEVIVNKKTGLIVNRDKYKVIDAINWATENFSEMQEMTKRGQKLVLTMFDVKRTSKEIKEYYNHVNDFNKVKEFNSKEYIDEII